jgi:hypothetical protein
MVSGNSADVDDDRQLLRRVYVLVLRDESLSWRNLRAELRGDSLMATYPNGYSYRLEWTLTNASATSAISYGQCPLPITGAAYTSVFAGMTNYPVDYLLTDLNSNAVPVATEDSANIASTLSLLAKVSIPANGATSGYLYYGKNGASSPSSWAAVISPAVALSANVDVINQTAAPGQATDSVQVELNYQTGANAGLNGTIYNVASAGVTYPGYASGALFLTTSTDGVTWSSPLNILQANAAHEVFLRAFGEGADGALYLVYEFDVVANAGIGNYYCARGVIASNGTVTWTNLSTSPSNPITAVGIVHTAGAAQPYGRVVNDNSGNLYMVSYYFVSGATTNTVVDMLTCPQGTGATNGANWVVQGTIAASGATGIGYGETAILFTGGGNWIAVSRNDAETGGGATGDLYWNSSSNNGVTWGTPSRLYIPGTAAYGSASQNAVSPDLRTLPSGNILLTWGVRYDSSSTDVGIGAIISLDGGVTFGNQPVFVFSTARSGQDMSFGGLGYSTTAILPSGVLSFAYWYTVGGSSASTTNVGSSTWTEDGIVNGNNSYTAGNATTDTGLTLVGANCTASTLHVHNSAHSLKFDNTSGSGGLAAHATRVSWATDLNYSANQGAISYWQYIAESVANGCFAIQQDLTPTNRLEVSIGATPYDFQWYDGSSYHDTGVPAVVGAWSKITTYLSGGGGTAAMALYQNGALVSNAIAQDASGNAFARTYFQAGSGGNNNNTILYVDSIYTHQYLPAGAPTVTLGAQQTPGTGSSSGGAALLAMM